MLSWIIDPNAWLALGTLTLLEIVLGMDNIVFLTLVVAKLPEHQRGKVRQVGLLAAMCMRLLLLSLVAWVSHLLHPLFFIAGNGISARDLLMLFGGLFLLWKSTTEIYETIEGTQEVVPRGAPSFLMAIIQIMLLDIIFSLDSVITAVGLSPHLFIMMAAVVLAVLVMMLGAKLIGDFLEKYTSVKILALAFLLLVGFTLILEGFHIEVPKGYIYFAMFFSIGVEILNLLFKHRQQN